MTRHYRMLDDLMAATADDLKAIAGIGPHTAKEVADFFRHDPNRTLIAKLKAAGLRMESETRGPVVVGSALKDKSLVLTGTLPTLTREAATALIEAHGGTVTGSVSKKTSYVLVGESPGSSKVVKAQQLNIQMLDEAGLMAMLEADGVTTDTATDQPAMPAA